MRSDRARPRFEKPTCSISKNAKEKTWKMFGSQKLIFRDSRCTDEKATAKLWAKRLTAYHRLHLKHPSVRESGKAAKTKNLTKTWMGIWRRQGQTVENSKNGGEQKGRRWVVKNRLEPLQNFVGSEVAWSSKRLCYHVCVETSFYKRFRFFRKLFSKN